jgi:hypothetical protein
MPFHDNREEVSQYHMSETCPADQVDLETGWFFYLAEIALKRIIHNVIIRQYKTTAPHALGPLQRESEFDLEKAVAESDTQIQEW